MRWHNYYYKFYNIYLNVFLDQIVKMWGKCLHLQKLEQFLIADPLPFNVFGSFLLTALPVVSLVIQVMLITKVSNYSSSSLSAKSSLKFEGILGVFEFSMPLLSR